MSLFCLIFKVVGFSSLQDFIQSTLFLKKKFFLLHVYGFSISAVCSYFLYLTNGIEYLIYNPAKGIYILAGVTAFDIALGTMNSKIVKKERIKSDKMLRAVVRFAVALIFISILFNMNSVWPIMIQFWVVDGVLIGFIISTLWSSVENARDLNLVTKSQYEFLEQVVNIKKIFEKLKK